MLLSSYLKYLFQVFNFFGLVTHSKHRDICCVVSQYLCVCITCGIIFTALKTLVEYSHYLDNILHSVQYLFHLIVDKIINTLLVISYFLYMFRHKKTTFMANLVTKNLFLCF